MFIGRDEMRLCTPLGVPMPFKVRFKSSVHGINGRGTPDGVRRLLFFGL